jgi:apolipoprotein N-acyltransferase
MTVFRAVENRRALVRSANTGISGFIDPAGRVLASTPLLQDAALARLIPLIKTKTVYTRIGDLFARLCFVSALIFGLLEIVRFKTNRKKELNQK